MPELFFTIAYIILALAVVIGIFLMSKVQTARSGNALSACSALAAIILTLWREQLIRPLPILLCLLAGLLLGLLAAWKIKMIAMPQFVALLNGLGGAASALVALSSWTGEAGQPIFNTVTILLALAIGVLTFTGSLVAAGKLQKLLPQKPLVWPGHDVMTLVMSLLLVVLVVMLSGGWLYKGLGMVLLLVLSGLAGLVFTLRIGGADMPITIALLNALSGVAGSVAGMAIGNRFLIFAGAVIGASGLLLTRIMCRAMNRSLSHILTGQSFTGSGKKAAAQPTPFTTDQEPALNQAGEPATAEPDQDQAAHAEESAAAIEDPYQTAAEKLRAAEQVIVVPGYGMALAQAQQLVYQLASQLEKQGKVVKYAIHPVAGRMPGHMNVLLAEVDVPYEQLYEMDTINPEFASCDVVLIVGANDVVNPAASTARDTPIYGMPVLAVGEAKHLIICNYDLKPGYAGVPNPLYELKTGASLLIGDASETLKKLINNL
ncbi:MAG: NAD(P)(+) transhydrogenase (Re/Si-specific) subunit beta [Ruminococcaceae bacterium]|nr:NAD(P)(+) transhydrogenase (Re/Si-specific) subunit beta [Oscillospiraceae bacterium]